MNAADTVIVRAITSGEKDLKDAKDYLKEKNFVASLKECDKAMRSYDWVAQYKDFSEIEDAVNELKAFVSLVKREQAYSEGEACLEKALEAMAEDNQHFPKAVLKAGEAIDCFIRSEAQDRVEEATKLKAKANGCLFEKQARALWAKKDFVKALDKCVKAHKCFGDSAEEELARKMGAFTKRVEGDLIMLSYDEAVKSADWDRACKVMTDAHDCYNHSNDPKIMSLIEGIVPKNKVMQEATKKGDDFKSKASSALHRGGGTVVAQEFLNKAKECFLWSDVSLAKAGVNMVQKDIDSAEFQEKADKLLDEAFTCWMDGGLEKKSETVRLMTLAKGHFKQAGASCFKSANDTSYIINVIDSADVNSLKCIEEMLVEEKIIDALDKCSSVLSGWTAVVRIQHPSATVKKFVDIYVEKEQQLILVMAFLSKKNSIVAEIQGNRWGPPPVAMCEELVGIHEHLKEMAANWKLTFGFEFLEPLVIAAQYACGILKEEEKIVAVEEKEESVEVEEKKEVEEEKNVVEEVEEEKAEVGGGDKEEKEEEKEQAGEVEEDKEEAEEVEEVVEEAEAPDKIAEGSEAREVGEGDAAETEIIEETPAEEGSQATEENQYADEEFESSVETTATANKDVIAEGGDIEVIDATNIEDEKKYENE
jgi:tetratricopeptide (TPR) repeat protein